MFNHWTKTVHKQLYFIILQLFFQGLKHFSYYKNEQIYLNNIFSNKNLRNCYNKNVKKIMHKKYITQNEFRQLVLLSLLLMVWLPTFRNVIICHKNRCLSLNTNYCLFCSLFQPRRIYSFCLFPKCNIKHFNEGHFFILYLHKQGRSWRTQ